MALPTDFTVGAAGHVEAHEATNIELNRVAGIADGLTASLAGTIRATLGATLVAGANVTITVNDAGDTVTIAATGGSGSGGGDIDASQIVSGTVPVARLGSSGTRDATTYLRGDNTWSAVATGGVDGIPRISGRFHYGLSGNADGSGVWGTNINKAYFHLFEGGGWNHDAICTWIRTGGGVGAALRIALYTVGSDGYPADLIVDSGLVDASVPAEKIVTLPARRLGWCWAAITCNNASVAVTKMWSPSLKPYGVTKDDYAENRGFLIGAGYPPENPWPAVALTTGRTWADEGPVFSVRRSAG